MVERPRIAARQIASSNGAHAVGPDLSVEIHADDVGRYVIEERPHLFAELAAAHEMADAEMVQRLRDALSTNDEPPHWDSGNMLENYERAIPPSSPTP